jgi:hypothetical protein
MFYRLVVVTNSGYKICSETVDSENLRILREEWETVFGEDYVVQCFGVPDITLAQPYTVHNSDFGWN